MQIPAPLHFIPSQFFSLFAMQARPGRAPDARVGTTWERVLAWHHSSEAAIHVPPTLVLVCGASGFLSVLCTVSRQDETTMSCVPLFAPAGAESPVHNRYACESHLCVFEPA